MDLGALAAQLIEAADEDRFQNPRRSLERAEAARAFTASLGVEELDPPDHGLWLGLQSDAWAVYGSAERVAGQLETAESALLVALGFLDVLPDGGHGAPPDPGPQHRERRARLAQRAGYVRMDQGRFAEALDLLAQARMIYLELDLEQRATCVRVDVALVLARSGRPREAIAELVEALGVLDSEAEPRSYLAAVHNLARTLLEIAETPAEEEEALRWLELAGREHSRRPERLHLLRLRALAALTAARFGRLAAAQEELETLAGQFATIGAIGDQVLTLLHAAELSLRGPEASRRDALASTGKIFPLLRRLPVDDEAKRAILRLLTHAEAADLESVALRRAVELVSRSLGAGPS